MDKTKEIRLFIAIDIPKELKEGVIGLKKELNLEGIKPVENENLHITMKFLGEIKLDNIAEIESALCRIKFQKFKIKLHGTGVFPNENYIRIVWIGCESEELKKLGNEINEGLVPFCKKEEFTPHLTIARVKKKIDLSEFLVKHRNEDFGGFECSKFELKSSILSKEGPIYETVAQFEASENI